jgi:hypothetical protein
MIDQESTRAWTHVSCEYHHNLPSSPHIDKVIHSRCSHHVIRVITELREWTISRRQSSLLIIMNFLHRHHDLRRRHGNGRHDDDKGSEVIIKPGQVEEAVHSMQFKGAIDLSQLHFHAESPDYGERDAPSVESFLDIVVFEVPELCSSRTCDLSLYGVGEMEHFIDMDFLSLCTNGRLQLNMDLFRGRHTSLMVPSDGEMPRHVKNGSFTIPVENRNYEVMIANCNEHGRKVTLSGQVEFDFGDNPSGLTIESEVKLTLVALGICIFFSILSIRIRLGTQADYNYHLVQNGELSLAN